MQCERGRIRGVTSWAIVEHLDVFEDYVRGPDPSAPPLAVQQLDLH